MDLKQICSVSIGTIKQKQKAKYMKPVHKKLLTVISAAIMTASLVQATCYVVDSPNKVNCATSGTDQGATTTSIDDTHPTGVCSETVDKDKTKTATNGKGLTSGITCSCTCTVYYQGERLTGLTCTLSKTYDALNDSNCTGS
jgi:hypothetical protein